MRSGAIKARDAAIIALVAIPVLYCGVAGIVFSLRHPWMTQTEKILCIGKMLTFGTVRYEDMRPREWR